LAVRSFDKSELVVVTGGIDVGEQFVSLAFDYLIFTGSSAVGRHEILMDDNDSYHDDDSARPRQGAV